MKPWAAKPRLRHIRACLDYVSECVSEAKRKYNEPLIVVVGDFNQWRVEDYLGDFVDIDEVPVGPTRGSGTIDRSFTNTKDLVKKGGTVPPLDADDAESGVDSDHRVAYARVDLKKTKTFEWLTYTYLFYNEDSERDFGNWI